MNDHPKLVSDNPDPILDNDIAVAFVKFDKMVPTTWRKLFSGYKEARIATYSFGLPFAEKLAYYFDYMEIIIGSPSQLRSDSAEIMELQGRTTNYVTSHPYMQQRIADGTLHLYVAKDITSHSKLYLLSDADPVAPKVRTIRPSANCSDRGWSGSQPEEYDACDDEAFYEQNLQRFNTLKALSTSEIAKDAVEIKPDGSNIDKLPMFKDIKATGNALVIHDVPETEGEPGTVEYAFTSGKVSKDLRTILQKNKLRPDLKSGGTVFSIAMVRNMVNYVHKENKQNEQRQKAMPQIKLDYGENTVTINGKLEDLHPADEKVVNDINAWLEYLSGYDLFTGDSADIKTKAWKSLVHSFAAPFFARLRFEACRVSISERMFPRYLVLLGPSDDGKTALAWTLQKLVIGVVPTKLTSSAFSNSTINDNKPKIRSLDSSVYGCPILIDDVSSNNWKYARDIVKDDAMLIASNNVNYPTYIVTSNLTSSVPTEVSKRMLILRLQNVLSKDTSAEKEPRLNHLRDQMSNAWFLEFAGRMFDAVNDLISQMRDSEKVPDVYGAATEIIQSIMTEHDIPVPPEFKAFTWENVMGEAASSEYAIRNLKIMYEMNPEWFTLDRKKNLLTVDLTGDTNKKRDMDELSQELPAESDKQVFGNKIRMRLDVIENYTGPIFKKRGIFSRFRKG